MDAIAFDGEALKAKLNGLPTWKVLSFGSFLLTRALPDFLEFQVETQAPGGSIMLATLAKVMHAIQTGDDGSFIQVSSAACDRVAPDTELYGSTHTSAALDAASIGALILQYLDQPKVESIVEAATLRRDTIDIFVQVSEGMDQNDENLEVLIANHPLMRTELRYQVEDLDFLLNLTNYRPDEWQNVLHWMMSRYWKPSELL